MKLNPALPIRRRESQTLELKSLDALAEPATIARGAVAMLNSEGGSIWIGIKEASNENGVNEIERIPEADAERKRRRLQDHLLDTIEPTPTGREISVTAEPIESGPHNGDARVLRVALAATPERRPYAFRRGGGRYYVRRVGDRTVPMSLEELRALFSKAAPGAASPGAAAERLLAEGKALIETRTDRFWLGLEPASPGELDLRALNRMDLLMDPALSKVPRDSHNFSAAAYHGAPRIERAGRQTGLMLGGDVLELRALKSGGIRFEAALAENFWARRGFGGPFVGAVLEWAASNRVRLLLPEALLDYTASMFRLVGTLLEDQSLWRQPPQGDWWGALAISGLRGWGLYPGNLAMWPRYGHEGRRFNEDLLLPEPLRFSRDDVREHPDDCARRLVERIYDALGIELLPTFELTELPVIGREGYSQWVNVEVAGGIRKRARLRRDSLRSDRFEWATEDGSLIPADRRWVRGWWSAD